jgi:hypothetical protein
MLPFAFLVVAAILFALAALNPPAFHPHSARFVPLGLLFVVLAMLDPVLPGSG